MSNSRRFDTINQTKTWMFILGIFELGLAYIFASWALDSGSWLDYFFTVLFVIGALQNFVNVARKFHKQVGKQANANHKTAKA